MSEERERRATPWLVTLLGAALLFLLGFGVGVVVGAARQEPALVWRHFAPEGEAVPIVPRAPGSSASAPSESTPAPVPVRRPAPEEATPLSGAAASPPTARPVVPPAKSTPGPAPTPPPVAAAPPAAVSALPAAPNGRFSIQVGAFAESAQAKALAGKLQRKGFPVSVTPGTGAKDSRWRVRVGPIASRTEADRLAEKLKGQEKLATWILDESR